MVCATTAAICHAGLNALQGNDSSGFKAKNMKRSRKERQHVVFIEINNKPEIITRVGLQGFLLVTGIRCHLKRRHVFFPSRLPSVIRYKDFEYLVPIYILIYPRRF